MSPTTSPHCPKYMHCKIHTRWTRIPSATRAPHNAGQCTRSNVFDKSKLMIYTGIPTASLYSNIKLGVTKCSSSRPPCRNLCCSSGCPASKKCSSRARIMCANTLTAVCRPMQILRRSFREHREQFFFHPAGVLPCCEMLLGR